MFNCCRVLLLASAATWPAFSLADPLPMPNGLSPAGEAWFTAYSAFDAQQAAACQVSQRKLEALHSDTKLQCDVHAQPPLTAAMERYEARDAGVAPLATLPRPDALTLAQFFVDQGSASDLYGDYLRAMQQFVATGGAVTVAPPRPLTPYQEKQKRDDEVMAAEVARIKSMEDNRFSDPFFWIYYGLEALFILGVSVPLLVIFGPKVLSLIREARLTAAGYEPPIKWVSSGVLRRSLVSSHLIKQRSAMPPFVLWYVEGGQDGKDWPGEWRWLSAIDGNPKLGSPSAQMQNYLQMSWKGERELSLYAISPETARSLGTGPYGIRKVPVTDMEGKSHTISIHTGTKGATVPQAPRPPEARTTHGSGREGTGDQDAEAR